MKQECTKLSTKSRNLIKSVLYSAAKLNARLALTPMAKLFTIKDFSKSSEVIIESTIRTP